jgi:hypothetical protein
MKNRYRIVTDNYAGYEAQIRYCWFPFIWFQLSGSYMNCNTNISVEQAESLIEYHKKENGSSKVIKYVD